MVWKAELTEFQPNLGRRRWDSRQGIVTPCGQELAWHLSLCSSRRHCLLSSRYDAQNRRSIMYVQTAAEEQRALRVAKCLFESKLGFASLPLAQAARHVLH